MESKKLSFDKETFQNSEYQENKEEPIEIYINEVFLETKNNLQKYLPNFYRDIPTVINYQDRTIEDIKINYHFDDNNLNINIKTPENLSGKTEDDLKILET